MGNTGKRSAIPKASATLESLRALGYSTGAAISDIVDNSIAQNSSIVDIQFCWKGADSFISIMDDGVGMNDSELESALNFGAIDPSKCRDEKDLGRFGMGLKTASLSQCRRLTVYSRPKNSDRSCLRWDLDELAKEPDGEWVIYEGASPHSPVTGEQLNEYPSGTLVVWEQLDRIVDVQKFTVDHFLDLVDKVEMHVAMTFHRYIEGPDAQLEIRINSKKIKSWDPFLEGDERKVFTSPPMSWGSGLKKVTIQAHVLPHKKLLTEDENQTLSKPDGWIGQQGFYVYRNRRLIQSGGWLGLTDESGKRWGNDAAHQLARIRVDITNGNDEDWEIDVRKSVARAPAYIKSKLKKYSTEARERASRVLSGRTQKDSRSKRDDITNVWSGTMGRGGEIKYKISRHHPLVSSALESSYDRSGFFKIALDLIENTVPVEKIWTSLKDKDQTLLDDEKQEQELKHVENSVFAMFNQAAQGDIESIDVIKNMLLKSEPFCDYEELIERAYQSKLNGI